MSPVGAGAPLAVLMRQLSPREFHHGLLDHCCREVEEALAFVAVATRETGFVVGETFSIADLTCAALLAPIADPDHPDMKRPEPMPATVVEFLGRFDGHEAVEWLRCCYREHRPASCAID